jgi:hypothetical protein
MQTTKIGFYFEALLHSKFSDFVHGFEIHSYTLIAIINNVIPPLL